MSDHITRLQERWRTARASSLETLRANRRVHAAISQTRVEAARLRLAAQARSRSHGHEVSGRPDNAPTEERDRLADQVEHLRQALASRDLIWSAKTIIAATTGADPEEAHRLLVRQSQHENRKIREIATEIVNRHQRTAS